MWLAILMLLASGCAITTGYSEQRTTQSNERGDAPGDAQVRLRSVSLEEVDHSHGDPLTARAIDVLPLLSQIELIEEALCG